MSFAGGQVEAAERGPVTAPHVASQERYRPELDGIRAFCILFTIFNHVPGVPWWINGTVGVDVFFALSGWLITSLLIREHQETRSIALGHFFVRRAFRILPLYYCTVALYVALVFVGAKKGGLEELSNAFPYMLTLCMEYRPESAGNLFGHGWTLGIEEKFYIVWPLILSVTVLRPRLAALAAVAALGILFLAFGAAPFLFRGYLGLSCGAGLAMFALTSKPIQHLLATRITPLPGFLVMLLAYACSLIWREQLISNVVIALGAAMVIASLWFRRDLPVTGVLSWKPLAWLGRLTYGIYLIQTICIRFAQVVIDALHLPSNAATIFAVSYAMAIGAAWVAHITVEKPMIRLGKAMARGDFRKRGSVV